MATTLLSTTRQAPKHDGITDKLRSAIARGKLKPGERLPVRTELESQLKASRMTVQKALDELIRDGFVISKGKLGTFVSEAPPCLNHYGLILPHSPTHPRWNGYYDALLLSLHELNEVLQSQIQIYYSVDMPKDESFLQLCQDVKARRLAGLMFAEGPIGLVDTELLRHPQIPMVASMSGNNKHDELENLVSSGFDFASGYDLACKMLKEQGAKRMGVIMLTKAREIFDECIPEVIKANGYDYNPVFCQTTPMEHRHEASYLVRLMMSLPKDQRPDGLFVSDDNLVPAVCRGLIEAGIRVGKDLHLATHRNYPSQALDMLPTHDVIYDVRQLLSISLKRLEAKRLGDPSMKPVKIKAIRASQVQQITQETRS
jgi:DNA-binding LacI/PurR family transcriptional regulator